MCFDGSETEAGRWLSQLRPAIKTAQKAAILNLHKQGQGDSMLRTLRLRVLFLYESLWFQYTVCTLVLAVRPHVYAGSARSTIQGQT